MLWYATNINERIKSMQKFTTFFLICILFPVVANALSIKHDFFVTVGAFDASHTEFTYTLTDNTYQIDSIVKTSGAFNTIYPFQAHYHTSGTIIGDKLTALDYNYQSSSRFTKRTKQVYFAADGTPLYQISSKNNKTKKRIFKPSPTPADTFDLQTIFAHIAHQYNTLGFCDSTLAVYDGKHRFDVIFKDEGTDTIPQNAHSFYSGQAAKCSFHIAKMLSEDDDSLWEFSSNKPVYFWIARTPKTNLPFIAHVQIKNTPLGELNAYTTQINIKE